MAFDQITVVKFIVEAPNYTILEWPSLSLHHGALLFANGTLQANLRKLIGEPTHENGVDVVLRLPDGKRIRIECADEVDAVALAESCKKKNKKVHGSWEVPPLSRPATSSTSLDSGAVPMVEWSGYLEAPAQSFDVTKTFYSQELSLGDHPPYLQHIWFKLRPNVGGKMELSLKAAEGWTIDFVVKLACTMRKNTTECFEQIGSISGSHLFEGGFISDRVASSSRVVAGRFVVQLEVVSARPTSKDAQLESMARELQKERKRSSELEQLHAREIDKMSSDLKQIHARELKSLKIAHAVKLTSMQRDFDVRLSRLQGEHPHIQDLDCDALEALQEITDSANERIRKVLKRKRQDSRLCKICMDANAEVVLHSCGHMSMCERCALQVNQCPICRADSSSFTKVFD